MKGGFVKAAFFRKKGGFRFLYLAKYQSEKFVEPHDILRFLYANLHGLPEVEAAHKEKDYPPFALQYEKGVPFLAIWGRAEEAFSKIAVKNGFVAVKCLALERLMNGAEGEGVTLEHVSPTAFAVYGTKAPVVLPHLYWRRPLAALTYLGSEKLKPAQKRIHAATNACHQTLKIGGKEVKVPGFKGVVRFVEGNSDLQFLARVAEFTGIGCKTAWGMGTVRLVV
jgi:hypothetical protein